MIWKTILGQPKRLSHILFPLCINSLYNKIYIIGGQDPDLGTNAMNVNFTQIYDPLNDSWSFGASMPTKVRVATACATTGTMAASAVYLFGGYVKTDLSAYTTSNLTQVYYQKTTHGVMVLLCFRQELSLL